VTHEKIYNQKLNQIVVFYEIYIGSYTRDDEVTKFSANFYKLAKSSHTYLTY